jgi:succinate dehydrogenase (ubiquinone) cytochrome b560 subunit
MQSIRTSNSLIRTLNLKQFHQQSRAMTIISKATGEEHKKQNYNERMTKTNRPVSPHVSIYSFPIAALTSITIRISGVALTFGAAGVGALEIVGGNGAALSLMQDIAAVGPVVCAGAKFCVAFPMVYHYLGGVRHVAWDHYPELLNNIGVEKASYVLAGSSLVLSTGLALM